MYSYLFLKLFYNVEIYQGIYLYPAHVDKEHRKYDIRSAFLGKYVTIKLTGVGMGLTWVVMPKVFTDNSTMENLQRNNTIWWCIYMMSMVIGENGYKPTVK